MAVRTISKNLAGQEDIILGNGSEDQVRNGKILTINKVDIPAIVDEVSELVTIDSTKFRTAIVRDENRGGTFHYVPDYNTTLLENQGDYHGDGGTIFAQDNITVGAWVRKYDGAVNVKWFGAKGDGITDDTEAIQKTVDAVHLSSKNEPYTGTVYISSGEYNLSSPILLYGTDGIKIIGDGKLSTVLHIDSSFSSFSYPSKWQALPEYNDIKSNPAVFQIAMVRKTFRNSLQINGTSGNYSIESLGDFYEDTDANGWAAFYEIDNIGIIANQGYEKLVHGIYGASITQSKFSNLKMMGVNIGVALSLTWSTKIEDIIVHESKQPIYVGASTSMFINRCNAILCERGYNIRANYSSIQSLSLDHWNSGYYAYDLGGHPLVVNGCGHEHGLGGSLRVGKNANIDGTEGEISDRTGITFNSCNFNVSTDEGTIYYQGQSSIEDYGVEAIHLIESGEIVFNGCETKAQSYPTGGPVIHFGALVKNNSHIQFIGSSDSGSAFTSNKLIFSDNASYIADTGDSQPTCSFSGSYDKVLASFRSTTDTTYANENTNKIVIYDTIDYDNHNMYEVDGKVRIKVGGKYKVTVGFNVSGDSVNRLDLVLTDRQAPLSSELITFKPTSTDSQINEVNTYESYFDCRAGEVIYPSIRYYGSGSSDLIVKSGSFMTIEQIA